MVKVGCIGLCSVEPIVDIQLPGRTRVSFQQVTAEKVPHLLDAVLGRPAARGRLVLGQHRHATLTAWADVPYLDEHPFFAPQTRWVLANCGLIDPAQIDEYIARGGYVALWKTLQEMTPEQVCDMVEASGLRGRGGGGFPTGKKWKFARKAAGDQKYLICNADEGDPGAFMDRAVIESDPHRLLEGMAIAAYAIGAIEGLHLHPRRVSAGHQAAQGGHRPGRGQRPAGREHPGQRLSTCNVIIKMGAGAFVCGEETALINSIEGKRGMPRPRPPFPAVSGPVRQAHGHQQRRDPGQRAHAGRPRRRVVQRRGHQDQQGHQGLRPLGQGRRAPAWSRWPWARRCGRSSSTSAAASPTARPTRPCRSAAPPAAASPTQHLDIDIDYESLKTVGAMMGSGGLVVMDEDTCMVDVAKFFMDFIQRESCGKCIPCREGTRRMLEILQRHHAGPEKRARHRGPGAVPERAAPAKPGRDHPRHQPVRPGPDGAQPGAEHAALVPRRVRGAHLRAALPGGRLRRAGHVLDRRREVQGLHAVRKKCPAGRDRRRAEDRRTTSSSRSASAAAAASTPAASTPLRKLATIGESSCIEDRRSRTSHDHHRSQRTHGLGRKGRDAADRAAAGRHQGAHALPHRRPARPPGPAACAWSRSKASAAWCRAAPFPAADGMKVRTHSPRAVQARKTIVELLLANHPDDCLYCVRNGNCELQAAGRGAGRPAAALCRRPHAAHARHLQPLDRPRPGQVHPLRQVRAGLRGDPGRGGHRLHRPRLASARSAPPSTRA